HCSHQSSHTFPYTTLFRSFKTLGTLRKDVLYWNRLKRTVATTVKQMPVVYLQNLNGQTIEFLYCLEDSKQSLKLLPKVMYCLRRSEEHTSELQSRENLVCR